MAFFAPEAEAFDEEAVVICEAFSILSKVSGNRKVKLRVVAEELLRNFETAAETTHFDG